MTDRHAGYVVTLAEDIREDDAEQLVTALRMLKGVISVTPITTDLSVVVAEERARFDLREKVHTLLKDLL